MSYYFWAPSQQNELYHYGVLGMKWGVHKVRSNRATYAREKKAADSMKFTSPGGSEEKVWTKHQRKADKAFRAAAKAERKLTSKSESKLNKLNTRYEKRQAKADRMYDKAERKASSFLTSKRSAEKAFKKASKYQFKANKAAVRGKKWYERMTKEYKKANISMTKENQEIGKELIRQVRANSRAMYAASYARG